MKHAFALSGFLAMATALATPALADRAPPPPVTARVIAVQEEQGVRIVKVGAGSEAGVDKGDKCAFYDDQQKKQVATCTIIRIDKRLTTLKTDLPTAQLQKLTVKLGIYLPT